MNVNANAGTGGDFVVLGKVIGAYGIKGWIRIHPFGDDPLAWRRMLIWWFSSDPGGTGVRSTQDIQPLDWQAKTQCQCRMQGADLVALIDGVTDRASAEAMRGLLMGAPRGAMPETSAGEYYWADLVGLPVFNQDGAELGKVSRLLETGANDVLVVVDAARGVERLLPFVDGVVKAVDRPGGIRVDWGLDW